MSIRRFTLFSLIFLSILFFTSIAISSYYLQRSNHSLNDVNREIRVVLSIVDTINHSRTLRVHTAQALAYQAQGNTAEATASLQKAERVYGLAEQAFAAYQGWPKQPGEQPLADAFAHRWQAYHDQALQPLMAAVREGDSAQVNGLITGQVPALDRQFEISLDALLAFREEYAHSLNEKAQSDFHFSLLCLAVFSVLFLLTLAAVVRLLKTRLLGAIDRARTHCLEIARGQLQTPVVAARQDEIGAMMEALESMRRSLAETIGQVRDASDAVAHAAKEIASGNRDLSARTEEQASSLGETAASMEQLTITVRQTSDNAGQVNELAQAARQIVSEGNGIVNEVIGTMAGIEEGSDRIASIISMIESIAFQTNILALNAAVEAARAGEEGRGFAVVAAEVRNLAQRSAAASKDIRGLIEQADTRVSTGSKLVAQAGESMERIGNAIHNVTRIMGEIAVSTQEQSHGIGQVNTAVTQMDEVSQHNAALVEEVAAAAASLEEQSDRLRQTVAVFTLRQ
ncbi:methyl-accepting chemotaxis protein [Nissabacter sp. SGAir0207]|uniref:methyl-accepting chemotaxis protein n=1 Tax=Nissabacter sp. SGAir0207 TaxID=2126321 RepID=UPI0010CD3929|nr:methyl-accepting chemotaxis protein [Nissabacter sp. SGAir0207]QCR38396.1 methyl-accepting chemotaxis protein [Nissabacter sp. SGAir0207]